VSDDRLDRRAASLLALDRLREAPLPAGDMDLEPVVGRGVEAAVAAVGDYAGQVRAGLRPDFRDGGREGAAVTRIAAQRPDRGGGLAPSSLSE
jgi:hypothetical protein